MTYTERHPYTLGLIVVLCIGLVLTVLAAVAASVVVAWSAGGITVGAALSLWR